MKQIAGFSGELVGKTAEEIEIILRQKGITTISEDALKGISKAFSGLRSVEEVSSMTHLLSQARNAKKIVNIARASLILDVAFLGFDIRLAVETLNEADLIAKVNKIRAQNKRNEAYAQLGIGVASFAAFAFIGYMTAV
jgi:hypothetical protein